MLLVGIFIAAVTFLSSRIIFSTANECRNNEIRCRTSSIGAADALIDNLFTAINAAKCDLNNPTQWPKDYAKEALTTGLDDYDFVIVGAGTAGSVVASRLSEEENWRILLIEAGGDPPIESEIFTLSSLLQKSEYAWADYAEPSPYCCQAMENQRCFWPRGKMIGGSGGINGNYFLPGNQADFDSWQRLGNLGWSWQEIQALYERALKVDTTNETDAKGKLVLNYFEEPKSADKIELLKIIYNATAELGIQRLDNLREGTIEGYTHKIPATIKQGRRMSTGKTYLGNVAGRRSNLHVIKNALVTKIRFSPDHKQAVGVEFITTTSSEEEAEYGNYTEMQVIARREVILCAGAINTPKLLMQSGIGPQDALAALGITVVHNLQVGANFHDHGMMPLMLKFNKDISVPNTGFDYQSIFDYFLHGTGTLGTDLSLMGFVNTKPMNRSPYPDLQLASHSIIPKGDIGSLQFLGVKEEVIKAYLTQAQNYSVLQIMGCLLRPKSRGEVRLRSKEFKDPPLIVNRHGSHAADQLALLRFVRFVQRLSRTQSFKNYGLELLRIPIPACDGLGLDNNAYWLCYIRHFYLSAWHPVGTCKMGPQEDLNAVVDSSLRVKGVKGLRVIDASIMPLITSGNTNGPTVVIAEKGAELIKNEWLYLDNFT